MSRAQDTARPENVTVEELRQYLTEVEGKTATQRIMVGINHKEGVPQTKLADWYDVSRTTIHNWLNRLERLEDESIEEAIYDDERPGRPSKLDESERERLAAVLDGPPEAAGIDASNWTPALVQEYIEETFGVDYCRSHVRELMHDSDVSWGPDRSASHGGTARTDAGSAGDARSEEPEVLTDGETDPDGREVLTDSADREGENVEHPQHRVHGCR